MDPRDATVVDRSIGALSKEIIGAYEVEVYFE
jgi:hypothetical protein